MPLPQPVQVQALQLHGAPAHSLVVMLLPFLVGCVSSSLGYFLCSQNWLFDVFTTASRRTFKNLVRTIWNDSKICNLSKEMS